MLDRDSGLRLVVSLGLIGGLPVLALQLDSRRVAEFGATMNFPQLLQTIDEQSERKQRQDAQGQAILRSIQTKERLAWDVVAGRLSLRAAATQFRVVGQTVDYHWDHYRDTQPSWSQERRLCQYVIDEVKAVLLAKEQDPSAMVRRLTAQADLRP